MPVAPFDLAGLEAYPTGVGRRAFLQAAGVSLLPIPRRRIRVTITAPGRVPAQSVLHAADASRKAAECLRGGALGRVIFVSHPPDDAPWRLSILGADATLTLEEAV